MQSALKVTTDPKRVHAAREATRQWIEDGRIELGPTKKRDAVEGAVRLHGLGQHLMQACPCKGEW